MTTNKPIIAILSGSFNPLHIGHVAIANYVAEYTDVHEVWFVVSPQNPIKQSTDLLDEQHRLAMLNLAVSNVSLPFKVCDIEFGLSKPSYTINTLEALHEKYPQYHFCLVMGGDNIANIERWKDYKKILANYKTMVYPRPGYNTEELCKKYGAEFVNAPLLEISATFIRQALAEGKNIESFLPNGVYQYIKENRLYNAENRITRL